MSKRTSVMTAVMAGLWLLPCAGLVHAHAERTAFFPQNRYLDPDHQHPKRQPNSKGQPTYRPLHDASGNLLQTPRLVVCKKPGDEGVAAGQDSAARIAKMPTGALKTANQKLLNECQFEHLQAAVDAVTVRGTTIYVLPGVYREQPSIRALEQNFGAATAADRDYCRAVLARGPGKLSYQEQFRCRFIQNTVAIFGDHNYVDDENIGCGEDTNGVCEHPETQACTGACPYYDLQVEGTGAKVTDVIFEGDFISQPGDPADGQFRYLNGIRADRADGIYLRNFTTQIYEFNAVYVMETDGYVFDRLLSRWVDEYAFLSFASDHGLYDYTEGYGVADSVQYPGSGADVYKGKNHAQADLRARQATEIRNSKGHHSALGYSGTAGNAPWVHNSEFYKNQTGMATESVFGGHPGMPQDHALWENNKIYSNNKDYYKLVTADGPCVTKKPSERGVVPAEFRYFDELPADFQEAIMDRTVVCPPIPFPTGTGMIIAGGNYDVVSQNQVFDNWRQGLWLLAIPTLIHKLTDNPQSPLDQAGISGPLEQNDPTGQFSTVNDVLGAVTKPENSDVLLNPVFTAHFNRVIGNRFGENSLGPVALSQPNGVDIWWDNSGTGNCFVDNTSRQGEVTSDLGPLGVMGLPTECADGDPSIIQQLITARPNRLVDYVECLNYSRTNPDSKGNCPFFSALNAPAGREPGVSRITSENPAQAVAAAAAHGRGNLAGYFVLHNDSNSTHRLQGVTLSASGPVAALGGLRLVVRDIRGNTFTAQGQLDGSTLSFSFDTPVSVPVQEATLVELERIQSLAALPADGSGSVLLMATLGLGGAGSLLLTLFGSARRSARVSLALTVVLALGLSACGGDSSSGSSGGGSGTQRVSFTLTQLQFEGQPADADYAGLPLAVGSVTLQ